MPSNSAEITGNIPQHVAIIMDGNGRWAQARGLPRLAGHKAGTENLREIIRASIAFGIRILSIYAFSTENWTRSREEVNGLMRLLNDMLDKELTELNAEGVQVRHLGRLERLPLYLKKKIKHAIEITRNNQKLILCIAWNYGGRDEIVLALEKIMAEGVDPSKVTEQTISEHLMTAGLPDPDLVIRTSGEIRTSNFMIWQAAYSELYFTPVLWPDFDRNELKKAIKAFQQRDRRFGGIHSEMKGIDNAR